VSKPFVCENYETAEVDKAGDIKVEECVWVPRELKSDLGYRGTLVSLRLPRNWSALVNEEVWSAFVQYKCTEMSFQLNKNAKCCGTCIMIRDFFNFFLSFETIVKKTYFVQRTICIYLCMNTCCLVPIDLTEAVQRLT
jgi:hypothetical protein